MGHNPRRKPKHLAEKLVQIRRELDLSQNELIRRLDLADELRQSHISAFESGAREPSLIVLLRYARVAGVTMENLVDDALNLPKHLPSLSGQQRVIKHEKSRRK